jgi:hypothetical protein
LDLPRPPRATSIVTRTPATRPAAAAPPIHTREVVCVPPTGVVPPVTIVDVTTGERVEVEVTVVVVAENVLNVVVTRDV